jgi:D,D-heptose 1,7-bisphosphate phosphatase
MPLPEKDEVMNKAIFLDRDGTIIYDKHYLSDPALVELLPGVADDLRLLKEEGFLLVLVSNQSGVARGRFSADDLKNVHFRLEFLLKEEGVVLAGAYHCVHAPNDNCTCRKPEIGMALMAEKDLEIDLRESYMVGDKPSDIQFGKNFGAIASFNCVTQAVDYIISKRQAVD